ncbi:DUF3530 family protein [Moritella viscosa]|uniref:DUF3530 family protein n=1 Tax=Moritella viscosa TaxID=80854 RepID=A0ABY1HCF7_9GAMM|nr:DUF3530 family protein [Moritella viscosa]SGY90473.1 Putative uncharacterized protein [Moritella viscosa]SGY99714.1 Putative uncharacterized protein [Moritella viscosa]SHO26033.1 Putative uncharacterized protein [Moritella viscosa]
MLKALLLLLLSTLSLQIYAEENNAEENEDKNETNKPTIAFPISQQRVFDQDLTKYSNTSEVAWLGDKEDRFLTLWLEQTTAKVTGTSWIFADTYTSANNPNIIQTLRYQLSDRGLHTYSISPLSQTLKSEQAEQRLQAQLLTLQDKIVSKSGKRLLIIQGANCQAMINVLIKNKDVYVDAIVLLSAHSATPTLASQLISQMHQLKAPILDLYAQTDSLAIINEAKLRRIAAKRINTDKYRQTEVIGLQGQIETQIATSQIIYGWLVKLGWY